MKRAILYCVLLCCFTISDYSFADGTKESPNLLECSYCSSDWQFKNVALENTNDNQALYFLVYNLNNQTLRTVYTIKLSEPEATGYNININRAFIISTDSEHQADFDDYIAFLNSGAEKTSTDVDYPETGGAYGNAAGYMDIAPSMREFLPRWAVGQVGLFTAAKFSYININFSNDDVAKVVIIHTASSPAGKLVVVYDKEGEIIDLGLGSITHTGGGAAEFASGGYTTVTFTGNFIVCYGACPVREGVVTITQNDE